MRTHGSATLMLEWLSIYLRYTCAFAGVLLLLAIALVSPAVAALTLLPVAFAAALGAGAGLRWSWALWLSRVLCGPRRDNPHEHRHQ
jgi:hypothetical protein